MEKHTRALRWLLLPKVPFYNLLQMHFAPEKGGSEKDGASRLQLEIHSLLSC